jgi:cell division transport system ATP-binding protein
VSTVVRFESVGLRYGTGAEVLCDIDLALEAGSLHLLLGPSGAGKTSLLKLLYLAQMPTRGFARLFGTDVVAAERAELPAIRRRIGVVFQDFRLIPHLTAFDNVALPLRIAGKAESDIEATVGELLAWVGLGDRTQAFPATLSGGEQQRVAIARAVVTRPDLLVADEPTGNIDPEMAQRLLHLFGELNKLGTTIVIATHDANLGVALPEARVLRLERGRLIDPAVTPAAPPRPFRPARRDA